MRCCMPRELERYMSGFGFQFNLTQDFVGSQLQALRPHAVESAVIAQQPVGGAMIERDIFGEEADTGAGSGIAKGLAEQVAGAGSRAHESQAR